LTLIVEDSMMVALDTADMIKKMGVETVEACATVSQSQALIQSDPPDFAILDVSFLKLKPYSLSQQIQKHSLQQSRSYI